MLHSSLSIPSFPSYKLIKLQYLFLLKVKVLITITRGGLIASALDRGGRVVKVRTLAADTLFCSWARHFTLSVPLPIQVHVYKWVPPDLTLGITLRWTSIPSRGEYKCSYSLHAKETVDKGRSDGSLGLYADFTFILPKQLLDFHWSD